MAGGREPIDSARFLKMRSDECVNVEKERMGDQQGGCDVHTWSNKERGGWSGRKWANKSRWYSGSATASPISPRRPQRQTRPYLLATAAKERVSLGRRDRAAGGGIGGQCGSVVWSLPSHGHPWRIVVFYIYSKTNYWMGGRASSLSPVSSYTSTTRPSFALALSLPSLFLDPGLYKLSERTLPLASTVSLPLRSERISSYSNRYTHSPSSAIVLRRYIERGERRRRMADWSISTEVSISSCRSFLGYDDDDDSLAAAAGALSGWQSWLRTGNVLRGRAIFSGGSEAHKVIYDDFGRSGYSY